jgi:hypothetical protein
MDKNKDNNSANVQPSKLGQDTARRDLGEEQDLSRAAILNIQVNQLTQDQEGSTEVKAEINKKGSIKGKRIGS